MLDECPDMLSPADHEQDAEHLSIFVHDRVLIGYQRVIRIKALQEFFDVPIGSEILDDLLVWDVRRPFVQLCSAESLDFCHIKPNSELLLNFVIILCVCHSR